MGFLYQIAFLRSNYAGKSTFFSLTVFLYLCRMKRIIYVIGLLAAALSVSAWAVSSDHNDKYDSTGAMVRHNVDRPDIYLVFSADSAFEGAPDALSVMAQRGIKASFFLTGNFLRRPENGALVRAIIAGGHYVGGHSDAHLLLADWDGQRTPLVSTDSMLADIQQNLSRLDSMGVCADSCRWFMPPYEWIAPEQVEALRSIAGLKTVNPTPGISIFRDYTTPDMPDYCSSDSLMRQLYDYERRRGLNGVFLIMHLGTHPDRTDKLYTHFGEIVDSLAILGYSFRRLP